MDFATVITDVFSDFADPKKRIFVGYFALSLVIAFVWLIALRRKDSRSAMGKIFDRKVWFSKSSRADYAIFVINQIVSLLVSPLLLTQLAIGTAVFFWLHKFDFLSRGLFTDVSTPVVVALFTGTLFLVDDLTKYLVHRWMHRWPLLWSIHKVHHSAKTMTPITVYRVHPLEGILYGMRSTFAQGTVIGAFIFFFGGAVDLATVLGVNVLSFIFHVTGSNLRHSHIQIRYWPWLERILISPAQHQVHHSTAKRHFDKNFGVAFAVWDWMFGSLHLSEEDDNLTFGLPDKIASADNLFDIYTRPFVDIWRVITSRIRALFGFLSRSFGALRPKS